MTLVDSILAGGPWASVVLVQVTLVALLGLSAWLVARRGGPALRAAVLLAALLALLTAPGLAPLAPVWLPLPEAVCGGPASADADSAVRAPPPPPPTDRAVVTVLVTPAPAKAGISEEPVAPAGDPNLPPTKAEALVFNLTLPPEEPTPPAVLPAKPARPSWSVTGVLVVVWLLGALMFLTRAGARLALLYRCARWARPVRETEWTDAIASLAGRHGLPTVALRESRDIASPLTLGLFRPVILLPRERRHWSAGQRALILGHELAHVRRRDFLAGLVAELAACLCWFHPLVRYLAGRLRLEQEYAADAWVASATSDPTTYVRCLARLALELGRGRGSLAPAFWRRRPEILRRIDMLRRNPEGLPAHLGRRAGWMVAVLAAALCLAVAGVGPLRSAADDQKAVEAGSATPAKATADAHGDPLPDGVRARLGTTRLRHEADVTFVAYGPDGKTLLTAGRDHSIRLWDLATGKEIRRYTWPKPADLRAPKKDDKPENDQAQLEAMIQIMVDGDNDRNRLSVALAPDGKTLAAVNGGVIQLWEVETGKALRQIPGPASGVAGLLFSPNGHTLAARAANGTLVLWAADTGKEIRQIKATPRPKGDGIVINFGGNVADVPGMAFTPDSKVLAVAATDYNKDGAASHSVKLWDLESGQELRQIKVPEDVAVSAVAVAPDGKLLAYADSRAVHLCEVDTGKEVRQVKTAAAIALAFAPDGKTLALRERNQRVWLADPQTGKELCPLHEAEPPNQLGGFVFFVDDTAAPQTRALAFSPDGQQVAAASGSTVRVWDTATGKERSLADGHRRAPTVLTLSRDGRTVVSWGPDRVVRRWEAATGKSLGAFPAPPKTTRAAFSPDGRIVALANADGSIRLHEIATGKQLHQLPGPADGSAALAFAPDGKLLAARGNGELSIRLYDVVQGAELRQLTLRAPKNAAGNGVIVIGGNGGGFRGRGAGLAFSPDGSLLVTPGPTAGDAAHPLVVFDVATGKELRQIEPSQAVTGFAFSPDGRVLATENVDRTVTLWEVASGKERTRLGKPAAERRQANAGMMSFAVVIQGLDGGLSTPAAGPVGLAFSPDGRALAVRGPDRSVRVWDVTAAKEVGQLAGHGGRVEAVAFAPDGKTLATSATDTTILLWDTASPMKDLSKAQAVELPAATVDALWSDLASVDAAKALRSVHALVGAPRQAVPLLSTYLKPAERVDPQKLASWISDLDSDKFAVRQEAVTSLLKVGEQAVPALRQLLASSPPLETRRRAEELVDRLTGGTRTTEQLRMIRAVEALERIGTPEARQVLRTLAQGAPGALPTREAQAALQRMEEEG